MKERDYKPSAGEDGRSNQAMERSPGINMENRRVLIRNATRRAIRKRSTGKVNLACKNWEHRVN